MQDNTHWTPSPDDNKLGLVDKVSINEYEAKGIAAAELFVFSLDSATEISSKLRFIVSLFLNYTIGLESGEQFPFRLDN
jgi:hypothetical protein